MHAINAAWAARFRTSGLVTVLAAGTAVAWPGDARSIVAPADRAALLARAARAYYPGRTGQIVVVPREGHIITRRDPAVRFMHGSPWDYDARIPFLIHGPAFIRAGTFPDAVVHQDMAPTLASLVGASMPGTSSGRPLRAIVNPAAGVPRLVVLVVLDGVRADYFERYADALTTMGRLRREGAWFPNARIDYVPTITSVGHATIATGADPRVHGIVGNTLFDRTAGKASDAYPDGSPDRLMAPTLSDVWSLHTDGRAAIVAQGSIARAAISLAGRGACQANGRSVHAVYYNLDRGGWETNAACYRMPDYLKDANARVLWQGGDGLWMGHPIAGPVEIRGTALFSRFEADALTLTIEHEPLGLDEVPDLLLVNLKTPDFVGHRYGPDSRETREALAALDRDFARVVAALDRKAGRHRYVIALTADHGMPSEPDARLGRGRHYADDLVASIHEAFDPDRRAIVSHYEPENGHIAIDRGRLRALGLELDAISRFLEAQPFVFAAYTEQEVARAAAQVR